MKKVSKSIVLLLCLTLCLQLCACAATTSTEPPAATAAATPAATTAPIETTPAASSDEVYEIRLASAQADGNDLDITLDLFAELAAEKSDGRVIVTVYPGTILGNELTTTEMVQYGQLEMSMTSTGIMENFDKSFSVVCFPNLFDDYDHVIAATRGEWGKSLSTAAEAKNIKILGYTCNGFMNIGSVGKPVAGLEDMKGLNIRCIESAATIEILAGWGCNPVPMAFSEVPTSLQLGAIDGCFLNPLVFISTGIVDIMDYYTHDWSVGIGLCPVVMDNNYFNGLPEDIQTIIEEAWREAEDDGWRRTEENQEANLQILVDRGVEMVYSTEEQLAELKTLNEETIWPKLIGMGLSTQETVDLIRSYAK